MFLRLERQINYITGEAWFEPDLLSLARLRINLHKIPLDLVSGQPSPLESPALGAIVLRILAGDMHKSDIVMLDEAVKDAIRTKHTRERRGHVMGCDEVLYGRAGLLWALLNIRKREYSREYQRALEPVFADIPQLVEAMITTGQQESLELSSRGEKDALPLMWPWIDHFCGLGA